MKNAEQPINPLTPDLDSSKHECIGLTKREYFAGLAMQGELASQNAMSIRDAANYIGIEEKDYDY